MLGAADVVAFVPTADFERSRAFYEGVLGLRFVGNDGFAMVLDAKGVMIRVAKVPDFTPAPFTILGWEVANLEGTVSALQKKGVRFERFGFFEQDALGVWTAPSGDRVAWFKDPDGNLLSLSSASSPSTQ
ncbi:MAG TPA: VOC family protein [Vicinamibacterales bacterium]|jgi:catechol 2,3-dioxygenase-like lactoylglutathione lyase family enzyme|nr:VOC family protein [Vicinamibacterales bacterium]